MIRQLLTESILLAGLGGCVGVGLAFAGVRAFQIFVPRDFPRFAEVQLSPGVLAFACGIALLTGLLFGLAPALFGSTNNLSASLKQRGISIRGRSRARLRPLLVITEIALALVLLSGAGLLINSTIRLQNVDPGFNPDNLLLTEIGLRSSYTSDEQRAAFIRELLERAQAIPGVESVAAIADPPMGPVMWLPTAFTEGSDDVEPPPVAAHLVAGEFFETMGIRLLAGRTFTLRDDAGHPDVVIVNETMARRYWPSEDPVGRRIRLSRDPEARRLTVVGVVNDIRHVNLSSPPEPELYVPYSQNAWFGWMSLVVRTRTDPETVSGPLRRAIWTIDPTVPFEDFSLMDERLSSLLSAPRFRTFLLTGFAVIALVLAVVGVYGSLLYTVGQRMHEVGIRMALGAQPSDILQIILRQGLVLIFAGTAAGIVGFVFLSRLLESFLFGVTATDPATMILVTALLSATALLACIMPARKAARVDPMVTLRSE
jgi:putative ABC transport system permease protein